MNEQELERRDLSETWAGNTRQNMNRNEEIEHEQELITSDRT